MSPFAKSGCGQAIPIFEILAGEKTVFSETNANIEDPRWSRQHDELDDIIKLSRMTARHEGGGKSKRAGGPPQLESGGTLRPLRRSCVARVIFRHIARARCGNFQFGLRSIMSGTFARLQRF